MKRIVLTLFLSMMISIGFCQTPSSAKKIDSLIKKTIRNKKTIIRDKDSIPIGTYLINRKNNLLKWVLLVYPKERALTFWFLNNELVKAMIQVYSDKNKAGDRGVYYFSGDSVIHKKEVNIPAQNIEELQKLAAEALIKFKLNP